VPGAASLVADEIADVGPAAPAAATGEGVAFVTRGDEVVVARLDPSATKGSAKPGKTPIHPIDRDPAEFATFGRAPAVLDGQVYWVAGTRLLRRPLARGPLQELARAAREGTRVSAVNTGGKVVVAYIAQGNAGLVARVWIEGHGERDLSPEGSAANSVALASPAPGELIAVALEGRTAMTPVHGRHFTLGKDGAPRFSEDVVVWVGSSAQPLTELTALASPSGDVAAFVAIERDVTHFGLAKIPIGARPSSNVEASWLDYPNGIEPAPVVTGVICGEPMVLYVRPSEARPHAPQELHLAPLDALGASQILARGRTFSDVSLAARDHGALVSYVADRRTWALGVRCPSKATRHH
jgi:hypothetical protein